MHRSESCSTVTSSATPVFSDEDKHGSSGNEVIVRSNFFPVTQMEEFNLTQYRVDFEPEVLVTFVKKKIIAENKDELELTKYIFDGNNLYFSKHISNRTLNTIWNNQPMQITIKRTNSIKSTDPVAFQIFNLIFRDAMSALKLQQIRHNFFDPAAKKEITNANLEILPGYLSSIRAYENKNILLCAQTIHKFLRKETIYSITKDMMKTNQDGWRDQLKREIVGTIVLTDYTNKTYQVDDIDYSMTANSTFTTNDGKKMTYVEYYQNKYNIKIQDYRQFMLVSRAKEKDIRAGQPELIYLIPELCRATGVTDKMRVDFKLMQEISEHTRLNPQKRVEALNNYNNRLQTTPESIKILSQWNMDLKKDLITIKARELPHESIVFGDGNSSATNEKGEWSIRGRTQMYKTVDCKRWVFLYPETIENESKIFLRALLEAAKTMNYIMTDPLLKSIPDDRQQSYVREIEAIKHKNPKLIVIALPTNRADRYSSVKNKCMVEFGIPCQVVVKNRVMTNRNLHSICTKIAIQINAKLGGMPWTIKLPVKGLMTIGFDISNTRDKSIGALVATMDLNQCESFYSVTMEYRDGNEMTKELDRYLQIALQKYKEKCNAFPEKIIFYRDGVGEGQIPVLMEQEVDPMLRLLDKFYKGTKFAYILVNKRTNARFFKQSGDRFFNPKPGTIVDRVVTSHEYCDFFLVAQNVGQGTVTPTHYTILVNSTGLSTDRIQILTFKMCHLYFNWSGTVRIPAVSQYAKKLAFMTNQSLQRAVHEDLRETLYFL